MNLNKFAEFIRKLRKEKKLTQEEVADILHVHRTTYVKWEGGTALPLNDSLMMLSEFYGVSVDELLAGERLTKDNVIEVHNKLLLSLLSKNRKFSKLILRLVISIVIFIVAFLIYYFVTTYNSIHVYLLYGENEDVKARDSLLFVTNDVIYLRFGNIYLNEGDKLLNINEIKIYANNELLFNGDPKQIIIEYKKNIEYVSEEELLKHLSLSFEYDGKTYTMNLNGEKDFKNSNIFEDKHIDVNNDLEKIDRIKLDSRYKYDEIDNAYYYKDSNTKIKCSPDVLYCVIDCSTNNYEISIINHFLKVIDKTDNTSKVIYYDKKMQPDERSTLLDFKLKIYDKYLK